MPHVNIWIRKEDVDNWNSIDNKADWLHFHLHKGVKVITNNSDGSGKIENLTKEPKDNWEGSNSAEIFKMDPVIPNNIRAPKPVPTNECEHGQSKGNCLWKGCKFGPKV